MPKKRLKPNSSDNKLPKPDKDIKLSMSSRQQDKDDWRIFHMDGNSISISEVSGNIVVGHIEGYVRVSNDNDLSMLVAQLSTELDKLPEDVERDKSKIKAVLGKVLKTAAQENPDKRGRLTELTIELGRASEDLSAVAPTIVLLVKQIIAEVVKEG
ncbi:MAG: hypothetical protein IPK17_04650 [Chloroflexi bacterium]|uniref:hypothetical protein n=1 Tax=Candidatus Flexifilum breve TaxID=3140694 RepID=UPI0031348F38|nr:hypothetical protein [Chloroflexota bacterium]